MLPIFSTVSHRSPEIAQLSNLKQLAVALRASAEEHDGRFPAQISELPPDSVPAYARQFRDPTTKQAHDWLYYPGRTLNDLPGTVLAASPATVYKRKRIVTSIDTVTTITDESEFQKLISEPQHK